MSRHFEHQVGQRIQLDDGRRAYITRRAPIQPAVHRTFPSRSAAARWLATTHAVSQGWEAA
jgi:hypothetical protein